MKNELYAFFAGFIVLLPWNVLLSNNVWRANAESDIQFALDIGVVLVGALPATFVSGLFIFFSKMKKVFVFLTVSFLLAASFANIFLFLFVHDVWGMIIGFFTISFIMNFSSSFLNVVLSIFFNVSEITFFVIGIASSGTLVSFIVFAGVVSTNIMNGLVFGFCLLFFCFSFWRFRNQETVDESEGRLTVKESFRKFYVEYFCLFFVFMLTLLTFPRAYISFCTGCSGNLLNVIVFVTYNLSDFCGRFTRLNIQHPLLLLLVKGVVMLFTHLTLLFDLELQGFVFACALANGLSTGIISSTMFYYFYKMKPDAVSKVLFYISLNLGITVGSAVSLVFN